MRLSRNKVLLAMADVGFTQNELADKAKISRTYISKLINGHTCTPVTVHKIAIALNVTPRDIVQNTEEN